MTTRTLLAALALLAAPLAAPRAEAQAVASFPTTYGWASPASSPWSYAALSRPAATSGFVAPYSYYVVPYPFPARLYVPYGANDIFPYYGQPYGHSYDRWSWAYLGGYPAATLARYFYPPL